MREKKERQKIGDNEIDKIIHAICIVGHISILTIMTFVVYEDFFLSFATAFTLSTPTYLGIKLGRLIERIKGEKQ